MLNSLFMVVILLFASLVFNGCSSDAESPKGSKQNPVQESVKTGDKLEITIKPPAFDSNKQQPKVEIRDKKGSSLDF